MSIPFRCRIALIWSALTIVFGACFVTTAVHAAGTVTNCTQYDGGSGSQTLAQALAGGGTITFACSGTIVVPQITLSQGTIMDGTGQSVTLSGGGANQVLHVSPGITVELR